MVLDTDRVEWGTSSCAGSTDMSVDPLRNGSLHQC